MNTKLVTTCLVAGALMLPTIGYTDSDADRSSPTAFVKDSVITTKIKTELAGDKLSSLMHIRVDTDNRGVVVLSGSARNKNAMDRAVSIARGVSGVVSVQNNIQVKADL